MAKLKVYAVITFDEGGRLGDAQHPLVSTIVSEKVGIKFMEELQSKVIELAEKNK